jgi:hypothetical protein
MKRPVNVVQISTIALCALLVHLSLATLGRAASENNAAPVADAGLPVYAGRDPVTLDGTGSYDPDGDVELVYAWQQISGPSATITDSDTATPTIDGFVQTDALHRCVFELTVYDGQYASAPDTVELRIVPDWGSTALRLESDSFETDRLTVIWFSGGDCITGSGYLNCPEWNERANLLSFGYFPDDMSAPRTYERVGDLLMTYLSSVAPHYAQPIQTMGASTGGMPAIDVATYVNLTYRDARYAVNRVSLFDAGCRDYAPDVVEFLASAVDSEQCWLDTYEGTGPDFFPSVLNVEVAVNDHGAPGPWYRNSLTNADMNQFNGGLVAGAYWSVIGPGKNLQLASTGGEQVYAFHWNGSNASGTMEFYDEASYPGRLPEPVTLIGPIDAGNSGGAVLTCYESENAVGYELLFGSNPNRAMDFEVFSDTPLPPGEVITELPDSATWWTIRARDAYGSTIHADPKSIDSFQLMLSVLNVGSGVRYGTIQDAIDEAADGDEIVLGEGLYEQDITLNKNITIRSADPDDSRIVTATVLCGRGDGEAVVTFGPGAGEACVLRGLTVAGSGIGIACAEASPTISQCVIAGNGGAGIKPQDESNPTIVNCVVARNGDAGIELRQPSRRIQSRAMITNCTVVDNAGYGIWGGAATVSNSIVRLNTVQIEGNMVTVTYSDVQDGYTGEGNLDVDPLFADVDSGDYHLRSTGGRWEPSSDTWASDDVTSPCVDTGDPSSDVGDEPHPNGDRINMGAYGGTREASKTETFVSFLWETPPSFKTPESVVYDRRRDVLYVSSYNIRGGFTTSGDRSPDEFISRVTIDGEIDQLEWVTGLISPTGMDVYQDSLFVVERGGLVEIDIEAAQIVNRYPISGSGFLNDVVFDSNGVGYVSDNSQNASVTIYRFVAGQIEPWIRRDRMYRTNGLCLDQNRLVGSDYNSPYVKGVRLSDGQVDNMVYVGSSGIVYDGLRAADETSYVTSDWGGGVFLVTKPDTVRRILDLTDMPPVAGSMVNTADIEYIPEKKLIIIPTFHDNRVLAYELLN